MTNLRIYTSYPEGVNDHKGFVEYITSEMSARNIGNINFDYGVVIYDKVADKVAFIDAVAFTSVLPA